MEKLKRSELFGAALVPVTGALVERYNKCLSFIGTAPTQLTSFHIDAMGWSPEIADEKDDFLYLNSGEANPNAIILSPKQNDIEPIIPSLPILPSPKTAFEISPPIQVFPPPSDVFAPLK